MVNKKDERVVILCGGKGTRIRDVSESLPKPMVPIGKYPILWHIMKGYSTQGYHNFVLCLGHKGDTIRNYFLHYKDYAQDLTLDLSSGNIGERKGKVDDWSISFVDTGEETNTGKRLDCVREYLVDDSHFMLTYGDGVSDVNLERLLVFHQRHPGIVGTFTGVREWSKYGKVKMDERGIAHSFEEKPLLDDRVNGGFMVLNRDFLDHPLLKQNVPLERTIGDYCQEKKMAVYSHDGFWYSMDEPREYEHLNKLWAENKAPWRTW